MLGAAEGTLAVLAMRAMNASSQNVSMNSLPAIFVLGRADSFAKDVPGKMRSHCVSTNRKEMAQIQADALKLGESFEKEMAAYEKFTGSPEEARLREAAVRAEKEFFLRWSRIEPVSASGNKKEAMKRFLGEGMQGFQALQKSIAALSDYKKNEADQKTADSTATARRGELQVAGIVVRAILCGAALSWLLVGWVKDKVGGIAHQLGRASGEVTRASGDVACSSSEVSDSTVAQAASLEQTAAASAAVSATAALNAEACTRLIDCLRRVEAEMGSGGKAIEELNETIAAIVQSSQNISKVLQTIDGIAFQTNILALNAAVEAARAGQAGLGFAVVGDEVRNLSLRCAEASRQTGELIEESVRNAREGEVRVVRATRLMASVTGDAARASELGANLDSGSQEQAASVAQIASTLSDLERINQRNAAGAERSSGASQQLDEEAKSLQTLLRDLQAIAG